MSREHNDLAGFSADAARWLAEQHPVAAVKAQHSKAVFHSLAHEEEAQLIRAASKWQREKFKAGFGAICWPVEYGGRALPAEFERAFQLIEQNFAVPADHELRRITTNLVAPTIRDLGSESLRNAYIEKLLTCRLVVCQLFSEPGAGSDLANLQTRGRRTDEGLWMLSGSKVWVSGAQFADLGMLLARTEPAATPHAGITAFLLPMSSPGLDVRPIRQMTGGSSFNEVFLHDVVLHDDMRVGPIGEGWTVARTMLAYERSQSGSRPGVGGSWEQLRSLARDSERAADPTLKDELVQTFLADFLRAVTRRRADLARFRGAKPGAEGSIGKLSWAESLTMIGETAASLAGPDLVSGSNDVEAYSWSEHVLGAPGFHIAGGTDEIQRNIIGESILGLPREPRPSPPIS